LSEYKVRCKIRFSHRSFWGGESHNKRKFGPYTCRVWLYGVSFFFFTGRDVWRRCIRV